MGISACQRENLVPLSKSDERQLTWREWQEVYDPRHVNLTHSALRKVFKRDAIDFGTNSDVSEAWKAVLWKHPGCYLKVRTAVFGEQLGLVPKEVFYPADSRIDPNPYEIELAYPQSAASGVEAIKKNSGSPWRRPYILYIFAAAAFCFSLLARTNARHLLAAIVTGAFGFLVPLYFLAPAADARYIFPSIVFCALAWIIAMSEISERYIARTPH